MANTDIQRMMGAQVAEASGKPMIRISGIGQATDTHAVFERDEPTDLLAVRKANEVRFASRG